MPSRGLDDPFAHRHAFGHVGADHHQVGAAHAPRESGRSRSCKAARRARCGRRAGRAGRGSAAYQGTSRSRKSTSWPRRASSRTSAAVGGGVAVAPRGGDREAEEDDVHAARLRAAAPSPEQPLHLRRAVRVGVLGQNARGGRARRLPRAASGRQRRHVRGHLLAVRAPPAPPRPARETARCLPMRR